MSVRTRGFSGEGRVDILRGFGGLEGFFDLTVCPVFADHFDDNRVLVDWCQARDRPRVYRASELLLGRPFHFLNPHVGLLDGDAFGDVPRDSGAVDVGSDRHLEHGDRRVVATATVADLRDLEYKVNKAMQFRGARYIHVFVPCPLGWGSNSNLTVTLARLATQTGLFPVYEAVNGEITSVTKIRRPVPVEEYLKPQRRFAHVFKQEDSAEVIARIQAVADRNIRKYGLIEMESLDEDVQRRIKEAPNDPRGRFAESLPGRSSVLAAQNAAAGAAESE